jgi:hypothetical protein
MQMLALVVEERAYLLERKLCVKRSVSSASSRAPASSAAKRAKEDKENNQLQTTDALALSLPEGAVVVGTTVDPELKKTYADRFLEKKELERKLAEWRRQRGGGGGGDGNGTGYYGGGGSGSPQRPASPGAWDSSTRIGGGSPQRRGLSPARRGFAAGGVAGSSLGVLASFGGPAPSQRGGWVQQRAGQRHPAVQVRMNICVRRGTHFLRQEPKIARGCVAKNRPGNEKVG